METYDGHLTLCYPYQIPDQGWSYFSALHLNYHCVCLAGSPFVSHNAGIFTAEFLDSAFKGPGVTCLIGLETTFPFLSANARTGVFSVPRPRLDFLGSGLP